MSRQIEPVRRSFLRRSRAFTEVARVVHSGPSVMFVVIAAGLQTSHCTHLLLKAVLQTGSGTGVGMNGTARRLRADPTGKGI